jgi:uncharacterized membrane protein
MKIKKTIVIILLFSAFKLTAQLRFQNNSSIPVYVAYVMQSFATDDKAWYSHGWYSCEPGQTITLSTTVGSNPNIYWYAKSTNGKFIWDGKGTESGRSNLVTNNAFEIKNCNLDYVKQRNPNYYWLKFRHIKLTSSQTKYIIRISDDELIAYLDSLNNVNNVKNIFNNAAADSAIMSR